MQKTLNKILANKMQQIIRKIMNHDQVGSVQEAQRLHNKYKSIHVMIHISKIKDKNCRLSL